MMDQLLAAALVGTERHPDPPLATGTPYDVIASSMPGIGVERSLLLSAGAMAVYQLAGTQAAIALALPPTAPREARPVLPAAGAVLIGDLLAGRRPMVPLPAGASSSSQPTATELRSLLPEAFRLVDTAVLRLPHNLLAAALTASPPQARPSLVPVLGERGRWLASWNEAWSWVEGTISVADQDLDPELTWHEGKLEQRIAVLAKLRSTAPDTARAWLASSWKSEKAETRLALLDALAPGLSADDEPFMLTLLDDRSERVRERAVEMLHQLPASALNGALIALADSMLCYSLPAGRLQGLVRVLGKGAGRGTFELRIPKADAAVWAGAAIKSNQDVGINLRQVLSRIPPSHWSERFAAEPSELVAAAAAGERATEILGAWAVAALQAHDPRWISPLYQWWATFRQPGNDEQPGSPLLERLYAALPDHRQDIEIATLLGYGDFRRIWLAAILLTGRTSTWGVEAAVAYIEMLKKVARGLHAAGNPYQEPWLQAVLASIPCAALRLPPASFALIPLDWHILDDHKLSHARRTFDNLSSMIWVRHHMWRALAP